MSTFPQFIKTNVESESTGLSWPVDNLQMYTWMFVMMSNVSLFFSLKNILLILFRAAGKVPKARKGVMNAGCLSVLTWCLINDTSFFKMEHFYSSYFIVHT